ncbi:SDR family NAD(P)-dependent oxidoreductase [Xanthobacter tagetidis]|uniref:SDR family NAD(P)-dependent oxidoreductase n=1 Tax=Xanthobacter tagetidis TaxID=60216 RepID=A0A3L7AJE0_9HYPH|nr:SDR family NAD(P)-dependent oxidoreductase [Xanthobacter tagetidis]MBB6306462.1 NAD(P)-dependent dehydrogenase (short-subunit alcohol dehydrogenase family) [Xanthobacter tagetidis]RLP79711.1 SDR family NAD(P)-dependent oxidoreductase [Xanthobacter tagetidis]
MHLKNIGAIVTGGASGLGGATAARLAKAGARVVLFDRDLEGASAHAKAIGGHAIGVDVTDEAAISAALEDAERLAGTVRVLVNCAGIAPPAKVIDRHGRVQPLADFRRIIEINLIGTFNVVSKFAGQLHACEPLGEERGVIVNTASVAAFEGQVGQSAYAASKSAVAGMTLPLAREFAQYGIRVLTIAPGIFLTPMLESLPEEVQQSLGRQVPFPSRLGHPDEYAQLVESIIANPMLNGEVIRLDGAIRMGPR